MLRRGPVGSSLLCVIVLVMAVAGCIQEEEEKPDPNPVAVLTGPEEAWVGDEVQFDASGSSDDETAFDALDFRWDMGDNTTYKGKPFVDMWISAVNHTYEHEGTYDVNLTVTDVWGNKGYANWSLFIRYQLNMTVNSQGRWISEDGLNNTTYYNLTITNVWTGRFDVPPVRIRQLNDTGGELAPAAISGDAIPNNLTAGASFTIQVHFRGSGTFVPVLLHVTDELQLDLTEGA